MENFRYKIRIGNRDVSIEDAGDSILVSNCVRDLHFYKTGRFGYVISKKALVALVLVSFAIDALIVYSLFKLLG
jgi:hypothetical protein